jgi:hypothetical protein
VSAKHRRADWTALRHGAVLAVFAVVPVLLLGNLVWHPSRGLVSSDQYVTEWYLWHAAHPFIQGDNPLFTRLIGAPGGVNLMANPSLLGLAVPLVPVTLLFGAPVAFVVGLVLGLAGSATAWYWFFLRFDPDRVVAPAVGGLFCGFGPAIVAHAGGARLDLVVTAVVPFILALALGPGKAGKNGVLLGALVAVQFFISEEVLLLTTLGLLLFCGAYAALRPSVAREAVPRVATRLGLALAVAGPLLAFPLWWQFFGPGHDQAVASASTDVRSLVTLPSVSFIGDPAATARLAGDPAEGDAFLGVPLLMLLAASGWYLRRRVLALACLIAAALAILLSLGATIVANGRPLVAGVWRPLSELPVLGAATPARLALVAVPCVGVLVTLLVIQAREAAPELPVPARQRARGLALLAIGAVLVSVAPAPLAPAARPAMPQAMSDGTWQVYLNPGSTVLTVPTADSPAGEQTLSWQIATGGAIRLVGTTAKVPVHSGRTTLRLLDDAAHSGKQPRVGPAEQARARADFQALGVTAIVVAQLDNDQPVVRVLTTLLGLPPLAVGGLWLWQLRDGLAVRTGL